MVPDPQHCLEGSEIYCKVLGAAPCVPDEVDSCVWPEVRAGEEE
jgi:hypothetical protein